MGFTRDNDVRSRTLGGSLATALAAAGMMILPATVHGGTSVTGTGAVEAAVLEEEIRYARSLSRTFRSVASGVAPSVVSIEVLDRPPYGEADRSGEALNGSRNRMPMPPRRGGATGVVIDEDGHIVTNNHVIAGADEILVEFHDGRQVEGRLVGSDRDTDLAVIRVDAEDLAPARFGDSGSSEVGEWVLAVGSPFGLDQTVTAGIISAMGRDRMGLAQYESFIQTDAAINPGNSGGPMVNLDGEVIGINTAIRSSSGGSNGIGFAIPASMVERVTASIIEDGRVNRGWLGVAVQPLSDRLAGSFGYEGEEAVLVSNVLPNTPAAKAGIVPGDIITRIGGETTATPTDLVRAVGQHDAESEVRIDYFREGRTGTVTATLIERPEDIAAFVRGERDLVSGLGLVLTPFEREATDERDPGLLVEAVEQGSPAEEAGLQPGDVIRRVNGSHPKDASGFSDLIRDSLERDEAIRVLVERDELTYFLLIDPETG